MLNLKSRPNIISCQKLQELIRRGRPQDLVEANHLMKIMSGYVSTNGLCAVAAMDANTSISKDQRQKPNYKQQAAEELHRIQEKVILLNEMLLSLKPGDKVDRDDTIVVCDQYFSTIAFTILFLSEYLLMAGCRAGVEERLYKCPAKDPEICHGRRRL